MKPETKTDYIVTNEENKQNKMSIKEKFEMLTDEEKEKVILFVEQLKANRYSH